MSERPTTEQLREQIRERVARWDEEGRPSPKDLLMLSGVFQFGLVDLPEEEQLENAERFWDSIIGECCCCGLSVHKGEENEQPTCGHMYCYICIGRGHEDDCLNGLCEGGPDGARHPVQEAKS